MGLWYYVLGRRKRVDQCLKIEPGRHRHDEENVPTQKGKMFCAGFCFAFFNFLGKIFRKWLTIRGIAGIITPVVRHGTNIWGISSAGRALAWHARGHRFDSGILHQKSTVLRRKYGAFLFAFLEVTLKISQMPDFAGVWTATPNSCCFVVFENACSMPDCFAGGRITPPQCKE